MELRTHCHAVSAWEAETNLREQEVDLMERLMGAKPPDDRTIQRELDGVRRELAALGCDVSPMLNPTIPAEQSPVVSWTRKAPVHPGSTSRGSLELEPEPEPEPQPELHRPLQRPSVLRTSTATAGLSAPPSFAAPVRGPVPTSSRHETLGMVANYFATQLDSQEVDLGAGKVVKGFDTTGDGNVDSVDFSGDGFLDAKIQADGRNRASVSLDGKRARQKSMANRAVDLAVRATSKSYPDGGLPIESPRTAELAARRDKLKALQERRYVCCSCPVLAQSPRALLTTLMPACKQEG
eukprot:COSAG02_NODE_2975_length_7633_cov_3.190072_4_plen_295_part_00